MNSHLKLKNKLKELSEHESEKQYKLTREAKTAKKYMQKDLREKVKKQSKLN